MPALQFATLEEEIADLRARNAELAANVAKVEAQKGQVTAKAVTMRVSPKGCLSVYGLGRYPVTLYPTQWKALIGAMVEIKAFVGANLDNGLNVRDEDKDTVRAFFTSAE